MRVLVIGESGTIGEAVVKALHVDAVTGAHNGQVLDARKYA